MTLFTFGAHGKPSIAPKSHETLLFKLEQRDAERRRLDAQYRGIPARAVRMEAYYLKHKPIVAGMEKAA